MFTMRRALVCSALTISLAGCAPKLERTLEPVMPATIEVAGEPAFTPRVEFRDVRPSPRYAHTPRAESSGDIAAIASAALTEKFREAKVGVPPSSSVTVYGDVLEWSVGVTEKFPVSEAQGKARIKLTVAINGKKTSDFTYGGESIRKHLFLTTYMTQEVLGAALDEAFKAALADEAFTAQLISQHS